MRIDRNGRWFYRGSEIRRPGLVRLFAGILRREADGGFVLVTPAECWRITVEDVPFVAVDFTLHDPGPAQCLEFVTSTGDRAVAGAAHPLRMAPFGAAAAPYLPVRTGLDARVDRKSFYRLVALGEERAQAGGRVFGVRSAGQFFALDRVTE